MEESGCWHFSRMIQKYKNGTIKLEIFASLSQDSLLDELEMSLQSCYTVDGEFEKQSGPKAGIWYGYRKFDWRGDGI